MASKLRPWHAVATPHPHCRHGRLDDAVIAAKVWAVVQCKAPEVCLDPEVTWQSRPRGPQHVCTTP
jgi:hypothetical protein